jgi:hypothetical protein
MMEISQRTDLEFALTVGSKTDSITILGSVPCSPLLTLCAGLVGNRFVDNMPLNGRSFSSLIDLSPEVALIGQ